MSSTHLLLFKTCVTVHLCIKKKKKTRALTHQHTQETKRVDMRFSSYQHLAISFLLLLIFCKLLFFLNHSILVSLSPCILVILVVDFSYLVRSQSYKLHQIR
jgi:L-asparagine transporter-like permease